MDLEQILANQGYAVSATIGSCDDAELWLESHRTDAAFVDLELRDGLCTRVVELLEQKNIPFFICSGRPNNDAALSDVMRNAVWLGKPLSVDDVLAALAGIE